MRLFRFGNELPIEGFVAVLASIATDVKRRNASGFPLVLPLKK